MKFGVRFRVPVRDSLLLNAISFYVRVNFKKRFLRFTSKPSGPFAF